MLKKLSGAAIGACCAHRRCRGAEFPEPSMVMVIPFAAGGPQDMLGRIIAASA